MNQYRITKNDHVTEAEIEKVNSIIHTASMKSMRVLLIGGGDGVDVPYFPETTEIVYLDAAKGMVKRAKKSYGKRQGIAFINENEKEFDAVCLHFCLSVTEKPLEMLQKACDLIKGNGVLSILDVSKVSLNASNRWINMLTKRSMFDLTMDMEKLVKQLNIKLSLIEEDSLSELKYFRSYLYKKG